MNPARGGIVIRTGRRPRCTPGWGSAFLGVAIFAGTLPATRIAVGELSPIFLASGRAVVATVLGAALLLTLRQRLPERGDVIGLALVAACCVAGFPLLTSMALQRISASHSIVFTGMLPLATALFGTLRAGEQPTPAFWLLSGIGAFAVVVYALGQQGGGSLEGDALMVVAVVVCGMGYAEGAILSRRLGGWQVISWALLVALPPMLFLAVLSKPAAWGAVSAAAWLGFGYVSVFSMMLGFVFWYRGLALGGIAAVSQLQLLQPLLGLLLAALVIGEPVPWTIFATAAIVVLCVAGAKRFA